MEEERCGFNPANSVQIDPNETLRIPTEFQQYHHHKQQYQPLSRSSALQRDPENIQHSPFINRPNPNIGLTSYLIPPDSPLIHVNGRLSLKSPSINSKNYNTTTIQNSSYPQRQPSNMTNRSSKAPRPAYRRQS